MMQWSIRFRIALALVLAVAGAGCHSASQYISPRIVGRVVDETTREPVPDVQVRRLSDLPESDEPTKGGRQLNAAVPVVTGADGSFVMEPEKALAFARQLRWYTVTLSFERPGYQYLKRTYARTDATNSPAGEPLVRAGDIPM
jgi:hypothetical protein